MIEKIYKNKYMVTCDNCGTGQEFDTWIDALEYMFEEGWRKKLVDGEWEHYCPECQESEVEHDGITTTLHSKKEINEQTTTKVEYPKII